MSMLDNDAGAFLVLGSDEGYLSLWPQELAIPDGWSVIEGPLARQAALEKVEVLWGEKNPRPS